MSATELSGIQTAGLPGELTMDPIECEQQHLAFTALQAVDQRYVGVLHPGNVAPYARTRTVGGHW